MPIIRRHSYMISEPVIVDKLNEYKFLAPHLDKKREFLMNKIVLSFIGELNIIDCYFLVDCAVLDKYTLPELIQANTYVFDTESIRILSKQNACLVGHMHGFAKVTMHLIGFEYIQTS